MEFRNSGNGRALCLGKIEPRKTETSSIDCIDLSVHADASFPQSHPNYHGVWSRRDVERKLTGYSVLVLLSDAEAHALVVIEALLAGLSVLLSAEASSHLSGYLPFVAILEHDEITDVSSINTALTSLLLNSRKNRPLARAYALEHFSCSSQQLNLKNYSTVIDISIIYIATGPYIRYWPEFHRSAETFLFRGSTRKYFLATDDINICQFNL